MSARVTKVKHDGKKTEIIWSDDTVLTQKENKITSLEAPHTDFVAQFTKLVPLVLELLGLPSTWMAGRVKVTGVSFSFADNVEVEGAVITLQAQVPCADAPLIFNTPHLPFEQYSPTGKAPTMPEKIQDVLTDIKEEAWEYQAGKRQQQMLAV